MTTKNISALPELKIIRVLLVDDHSIVRQGLKAILQTAPDIQVVDEAENGREAVLKAIKLQPHVVLMDLAMPFLNGVQAARQIRRLVPRTRVLMLSSYNDGDHLRQAMEAGASGYLTKDSAGTELLQAVRETGNGEASFSPELLQHLLTEWQRISSGKAKTSRRSAIFSERQAEIIQLIAEGHGTKQIAGLLSISRKTVEKHRQTLMNIVKIHKVATLTRYAVSNGYVESNLTPDWVPPRGIAAAGQVKKTPMKKPAKPPYGESLNS